MTAQGPQFKFPPPSTNSLPPSYNPANFTSINGFNNFLESLHQTGAPMSHSLKQVLSTSSFPVNSTPNIPLMSPPTLPVPTTFNLIKSNNNNSFNSPSLSTTSSHLQNLTKGKSTSVSSSKKSKPDSKIIFDVITYLKTVDGSVAAEQLLRDTNTDLPLKSFVELLQDNPKISIDDSVGSLRFSYKSMYDVHTADDLYDLLEQNPNGIDKNDLADTYPSIESDLKHLAEQKKLLKVKNTERKSDILYPNCPGLLLDISSEFKELWKGVKVGDPDDVQKELVKVGLKQTISKDVVNPLYKKPSAASSSLKKRKRSSKRKPHFHNALLLNESSSSNDASKANT